jgi:hypothetical protein
MKKYFVTFGAGAPNFIDAAARLAFQARHSGLFDTVLNCGEATLRNDAEFWSNHGDFIMQHPRGFGYWLWKPYLIQQVMNSAQDGDLILYADAGCELSQRKFANLQRLFAVAAKTKMVLSSDTGCRTVTWTKADLIFHLNMQSNPVTLHNNMWHAGIMLWCVTPETRRFIKTWYHLMYVHNYHLITDAPSHVPNHSSFIEHRHDQAVFSLLLYKLNWVQNVRHYNMHLGVDGHRNRSGAARGGVAGFLRDIHLFSTA